MEVEGETDVEVECPYCKKKIITSVTYCVDIDMSDYAPDYSWYD